MKILNNQDYAPYLYFKLNIMLKNQNKLKFCVCIFILLINKFEAKAQFSIDSIVRNHIIATGFSDTSEKIRDFYIEGKLLQNKIGFPITIKGILPEKFRMDMVFRERTFIKINNGTTIWEYNPFTDTTTTGKCSNSEAQAFINRLCGSLVNLKNQKGTLRLIETTNIDDIEAFKIEYKDKGQSQIYYIDKYSFLILRIDDDFVENKITYYSDYRKVGQYYIPFGITGYENGMPVMSMKFTNIKINSGIQETEFAKPK